MRYMVRNNFLPTTTLEYILLEIKRLKNGYSRDGYRNRKTIRDSFDPRYCGTQFITNPRNILNSVWDKVFWPEMEQPFLETGDSGFIHSTLIREGQVLLSAYADGDSYGLHIDTDMGSIITAVLMLSFAPKFIGGALILDQEHYIPFANNRLVVFPSCMPHEVTKIRLESTDYTDYRFSLQYFISAASSKTKLIDESSNI